MYFYFSINVYLLYIYFLLHLLIFSVFCYLLFIHNCTLPNYFLWVVILVITKDRILHKDKMHVSIFNIIYLQSISVHKSLLDWLNINILYCIFLHILTLMHVLHIFAYFNKNRTNIQIKTQIIRLYNIIISNILRLKKYSDAKNSSIGWLYGFYCGYIKQIFF